MRAPSGEKKGFTFTAPFEVKRLSAPLATSTSQMFGLPEREEEEKKAIFIPPGDQFGWSRRPARWLVAVDLSPPARTAKYSCPRHGRN